MSSLGKSPTILVADDDEDDRLFVTRAWKAIRPMDQLRFVEDGEQLIDYLSRGGKYKDPVLAPVPSLIFLDLNMPIKDGREALREIKSNPKLRNIPIVVLTTSSAEEDISQSYDFGANSYITKPSTLVGLAEAFEVLGRYWIDIVHKYPEKSIDPLLEVDSSREVLLIPEFSKN
jgi:CheY-like chemotaxis protein